MTQFKKGTILIVQTKTRTFRAKAARTFSTQFDMIFPVYDLDRGGGYNSHSYGLTLKA